MTLYRPIFPLTQRIIISTELKFFIIKITLVFTLIGLVYSLSLENTFTANSIFYPHYQNNEVSQNQGLRSIAGLAGIDISGQKSENIPPSLYPKIISSPQFKIEMLDSRINLGEKELTYREYLLNKKESQINLKKIFLSPISFLSKLITNNNLELSDKNNGILKLSEEEYSLHENLSGIILLELNDKEGFIQLSVKDNNPLIASQIAKTANYILQKNIISSHFSGISPHLRLHPLYLRAEYLGVLKQP